MLQDESVAQGDMITLNDFLASTAGIYKKPGWLPQFHIPTAWELARWSLRQLGFGGSSSLGEKDFVVRANVEVGVMAVIRASQTHPADTVTGSFQCCAEEAQRDVEPCYTKQLHLQPRDIH